MLDAVASVLARELDRFCRDQLLAAGMGFPPVDAFELAQRLGFEIVFDQGHSQRASCVRLSGRGWQRGTIILRPDDRPERLHWAVAHELGEFLAPQAWALLEPEAGEIEPARREWLANQLAKRLLVPFPDFERDAKRVNWDLLALKAIYRTASHEVLARRMLDSSTPMIVTIIDHGRISFRGTNVAGQTPPLDDLERSVWRLSHETGLHKQSERGDKTVQSWAIHEAGWKREILRTQAGWMDW